MGAMDYSQLSYAQLLEQYMLTKERLDRALHFSLRTVLGLRSTDVESAHALRLDLDAIRAELRKHPQWIEFPEDF